jgi:Rab family protein
LVYDISNKESFEAAKAWLSELRKFGKSEVVILLVGNKLDLDGSRQVTLDEALAFADTNDLAFMETSAKTDVGVSMAFSSVVQGGCRCRLLVTSTVCR